MPAIYNINPTFVNPFLSLVYYGAKVGQLLSDDEAKAAVITDHKRSGSQRYGNGTSVCRLQ